jgi:hypothetical protein
MNRIEPQMTMCRQLRRAESSSSGAILTIERPRPSVQDDDVVVYRGTVSHIRRTEQFVSADIGAEGRIWSCAVEDWDGATRRQRARGSTDVTVRSCASLGIHHVPGITVPYDNQAERWLGKTWVAHVGPLGQGVGSPPILVRLAEVHAIVEVDNKTAARTLNGVGYGIRTRIDAGSLPGVGQLRRRGIRGLSQILGHHQVGAGIHRERYQVDPARIGARRASIPRGGNSNTARIAAGQHHQTKYQLSHTSIIEQIAKPRKWQNAERPASGRERCA